MSRKTLPLARVPWLAGVLCCASLAVFHAGCASNQGDAVVRTEGPVCLEELRSLLRELANSPENVEREAVHRFAAAPEGAQWLLSAYLDEVATIDSYASEQLERLSASRHEGWMLVWLSDDTWRRAGAYHGPRAFQGGGGARRLQDPRLGATVETLHGLQALLVEASLRDFAHPDYPELVFSVYSRAESPKGERYLDWADWTEGNVLVVSLANSGKSREGRLSWSRPTAHGPPGG